MECCEAVDPLDEKGHYNKTQAGKLYESYNRWCKNTGHKALSSTAFAGELERLGFDKTLINGKVNYLGILLKPADDNEIVM